MAEEKLYAVFGLGTFGYEVCRVLSSKGAKVIGIDSSMKIIERIKDEITQAVKVDSTNEDELNTLPVDDIDIAVVAIGESVEASIITTAMLKKLKIPYIVSRAVTDIHAAILKSIGADKIINVEIEQGRRIADMIYNPDMLQKVNVSGDIILADIAPGKGLIGKRIGDLNIRNRYNINIVSIKKKNTDIDEIGNPVQTERTVIPGADSIIDENDVLVVIGRESDIDSFREHI